MRKSVKSDTREAARVSKIYAEVKHNTQMPSPVSAPPSKVRVDAQGAKALHEDGWANLVTGLGFTGTDKRMSTGFVPDARLTYTDLTYLYRSDGLAKRAINLPVNDMLRAWYKLEGDTDGKIELRMKELDARKQLKRALRLARLFGGSLVVIGINDGQTYEKPVNENKIKSIDHLHVFDRWRMTVNTADLYLDPANQRYGLPERYLITPLYGVPFYVHESRVLRFEGEDVTDLIRIQNQGWADSVLQSVWDRLRAMGETYGNLETIVDEFIIGKMTITNLQEMIAAGKEKLAQKRLNYVDITKHIMNTILLDKDEEYDRMSSTVTGLGEVTDRIIEAFCASTGIPVCLFMGRSQGGLSDAEAGQVRFYYDKISGEQQEDFLPQLNRLINYVNLSLGSPMDEEWFVQFNPLWQPTQAEIITQRYQQAQADQIYLNSGVLLPEEVASSRFGGDTYTHETELTEEHKISLDPDQENRFKDGTGSITESEKQERDRENMEAQSQASIAGWNNKQQRGTLFGKNPQTVQPQDRPGTQKQAPVDGPNSRRATPPKPKQVYKNDASDGIQANDTDLESLVSLHLPKDFYGYIYASNNKLKNLVGSPEIVHGEFVCNHNPLMSLEGAPKAVLDFHINSCDLKSLAGGPEEAYDYHVHNNALVNFVGAPKICRKDVHAYFNKLSSFEGLPERIEGDLFVSDNQFTTLQYFPKYIGGDVDLRNNPKKFTEQEVRAICEVKGQVRV